MDPSLSDLEGIRVELEKNIAKLRWSLQHWQTWEAEYEGLHEGLSELQDGAIHEQLEQVASDSEGSVLTREGNSI